MPKRLSADNQRSLLIPEGFAHGFQTLTEDCELLYLHTAPYAAGCRRGAERARSGAGHRLAAADHRPVDRETPRIRCRHLVSRESEDSP